MEIRGEKMTDNQKKFAEENHNLIYSFLKKYNLNIEESYDIAAIGFCNAVISYDGEISKFSTYAYVCMAREIERERKKKFKIRSIPENSIIYGEDKITSDSESCIFDLLDDRKPGIEDEIMAKIKLEDYLKGLNDRDKRIISAFMDGYKQREISELIPCPASVVSYVKNRMVKYLI